LAAKTKRLDNGEQQAFGSRSWVPAVTPAPSWCACCRAIPQVRHRRPDRRPPGRKGRRRGLPALVLHELPTLTKIDDVDWSGVDFAFCCLPHGLTQEVIAKLPRHLKIVDLSADFRLTNIEAYATGTATRITRRPAEGGGLRLTEL
jgi:hypothetical protein